jgi:Ca2+-binding RTX toxin-like protein
MSKSYKFTITNGNVVAVYEIENGRTKLDRIDSNETWTYDAATNQVTRTETERGQVETTVFGDLNNDGIFAKLAQSSTMDGSLLAPKGYQFTIVDGQVTAIFKVEHGIVAPKAFEAGDTWSVLDGQVIKTETEHGLTETTVYADADGDGIFLKISQTYTDPLTGAVVQVGREHDQHGNSSHDNWNGGASSETYYGDVGNDLVHGHGGDDSLFGGDGEDRLWGDEGDDLLEGVDGNDVMIGGQGNDDMFGGDGSDRMGGGEGSDNLYGGAGDDVLSGGVGSDYLEGGAGDDAVEGGGGDDVIVGANGAGYDAYVGGVGVDTITYAGTVHSVNLSLLTGRAIGADIDTDLLWRIENVVGGDGDDFIGGNAVANVLDGSLGNDILRGGGGNDTLIGGDGADTVTGGAGADTFVFNNLSELGLGASADRIVDFTAASLDKIDLSQIDADANVAGDQAFTFLNAVPNAGDQTGTAWFSNGSLYLSSDADTDAEYQIVLTGVNSLTAADVLL